VVAFYAILIETCLRLPWRGRSLSRRTEWPPGQWRAAGKRHARLRRPGNSAQRSPVQTVSRNPGRRSTVHRRAALTAQPNRHVHSGQTPPVPCRMQKALPPVSGTNRTHTYPFLLSYFSCICDIVPIVTDCAAGCYDLGQVMTHCINFKESRQPDYYG
jgi:hypothetical protein